MAQAVTPKTAVIGSQAPNRLRKLREARGLTLAELADRVGTTNQQISHLELGKRQLTVEWLRRLGDALGCHPWAIVEPPRD
jgi:transcriptional regulator with XRE-family HTH domain